MNYETYNMSFLFEDEASSKYGAALINAAMQVKFWSQDEVLSTESMPYPGK